LFQLVFLWRFCRKVVDEPLRKLTAHQAYSPIIGAWQLPAAMQPGPQEMRSIQNIAGLLMNVIGNVLAYAGASGARQIFEATCSTQGVSNSYLDPGSAITLIYAVGGSVQFQ